MKIWNSKAAIAAAMFALVGLAGCDAQGDKNIDDGFDDSDTEQNVFPNDGTTTTTITENGTVIEAGRRFICESGIQKLTTGAATEVATGGLVGGPLTILLNTLGATSVTQLLNSVANPDFVIDNKLATYATFSLTLGGLLAIIDTVDLLVHADQEIESGNYAVFGLRFPAAVLELSLVDNLTVSTYLGETPQETITAPQAALDLLGQNLAGNKRLWLGLKTTKPFDTASLRLTPALLSVDLGEAMYAHELCTGGRFIDAPTP